MAEQAELIMLTDHRRTGVGDKDDAVVPVDGEEAKAPRRFRPRLAWAVVILSMVAVAGVAWWVGANTQSPEQAAAGAAEPEASWITAPIEFRVLTSSIVTRGDVRPEQRVDVRVPSSIEGDPVVTRLDVGQGDAVSEGDRLIEVSGRPVFVVEGSTPIYRSLQPGMTGDDVGALQAAFLRLGYPISEDEQGTFGETTKTAVTDFYVAAGYTTIATSDTYAADLAAAQRAVTDAEAALGTAQAAVDDASAGPAASVIAQADEAVAAAGRALEVANANVITDVDLAQSAVDIAKASRTEITNNPEHTLDEWNAANLAVATAEVALSDAVRDSRDSAEAAQAALDIAILARQELDTTEPASVLEAERDTAARSRDDAVTALAALVTVNGPTVPQGEIIFIDGQTARILTIASTSSDSAGPEDVDPTAGKESLLTLAGGNLVVSASISPNDIGLVSIGLAVDILDEATSVSYPATVSDVAPDTDIGGDGQLGHRITITADEPLPDGLAGANLRITMTAASTDTEQFIVPLTAVSSAPDGSTRVSVLDVATGEPVEVSVIAGLSADGFVAVEGVDADSLTVNQKVIVGR